jgi:nitroreductase
MLARIFETIRCSPSCNNNQPWRFVFVHDKDQHARFMTALSAGNQWAAAAPILIAVCARQADDHTRSDDPVAYYQFDCGLAVMSLLLAATEEGLLAHPMAGYDAPRLHAVLDIPADYHIMCVIAMGFPGSIGLLDERTRKKDEAPRTRKGLEEIICKNKFDLDR